MAEGVIELGDHLERVMKEQQEALRVAETEREKAALNLRIALERDIHAGDARLQDHITHQVEQVRQALASLTLLNHERDGRMDDRFSAHREAIQKAEDSLNRRLEGMNAFQQQITEERSMYLLRDTFDTTLETWTIWRGGVDKFQYRLLGAFGLAMIIMPMIVGVLVYFLTRTAIPIDGLQVP